MENPWALAGKLTRLRQVDKAIVRSRNVHERNNPSHRRERLYARRRRLQAQAVNVWDDNRHKATTMIAKSAGRVVVEALDVAGMMENRRPARAIEGARMSGFLARLFTSAGGTAPSIWRPTAGSRRRSCAPAGRGMTLPSVKQSGDATDAGHCTNGTSTQPATWNSGRVRDCR